MKTSIIIIVAIIFQSFVVMSFIAASVILYLNGNYAFGVVMGVFALLSRISFKHETEKTGEPDEPNN